MSLQSDTQSTIDQHSTISTNPNPTLQLTNTHTQQYYTTQTPITIQIPTAKPTDSENDEISEYSDDDTNHSQHNHKTNKAKPLAQRRNPPRRQKMKHQKDNYNENGSAASSISSSNTEKSYKHDNNRIQPHAFIRYDQAWQYIGEIQPNTRRIPSKTELETEKHYHQTILPTTQIKEQ